MSPRQPHIEVLFQDLQREINYVIDVPGNDEVGNALLTVQEILKLLKNYCHGHADMPTLTKDKT